MAATGFLVALLALSAYGKNLLSDKAFSGNKNNKLALPAGTLKHKLPFHGASVFMPLSKENMKKLLSKVVLKPWQLPKLTFTDIGLGAKAKKSQTMQDTHGRPVRRHQATSLGIKSILRLPELIATATKLPAGGGRAQGRDKQVAGGSLRSLKSTTQPTWLMNTEDLQTETCHMEVYNKTVRSKGCEPVTMLNRFCSGRCNSFFVPSLKANFQSCASCFPSRFVEEKVLLECPKRKRGFKVKSVQVILECKCQTMMSCKPL